MIPNEVIHAYWISDYSIKKALLKNSQDIKENNHFIRDVELNSDKGVANCLTLPKALPHQVY